MSQIADIVRENQTLTIRWKNGENSVFHLIWLKHNRLSDDSWHSGVHERFSDPSVDLLNLKVESVRHENENLFIHWENQEKESQYSSQWLWEHRYDKKRNLENEVRTNIEDSLPQIEFTGLNDDQNLEIFCQTLLEKGVVEVTGVPVQNNQVLQVAELLGPVWSHGLKNLYEIKVLENPSSLTETAYPLPLHTDLPSRIAVPRWQFLQCLENKQNEGALYIVDGLTVANDLKSSHPEVFKLLCEYQLSYRFREEGVDYVHTGPVIQLDKDGKIEQIRFNPSLVQPFQIEISMMQSYYEAWLLFYHRLTDDRYLKEFELTPGRFIVFDNYRYLHGRKKLSHQKTERYLQSCFVEHDEMINRMNQLPT